MKKVFLLPFLFLPLMQGCSLFDVTTSVSTVEELKAIRENRSYRLEADLDLSGEVWSPVSVRNFDGNGHTISNVRFQAALQDQDGGFFSTAKSITNLTLRNVVGIVQSQEEHNGIGVLAGSVETLRDVNVEEANLTVMVPAVDGANVGGISGSTSDGMMERVIAENISLNVSGNGNVYVGGISGSRAKSADSILARDITIDLSAGNNAVACGAFGSMGYSLVTNSVVLGCELRAKGNVATICGMAGALSSGSGNLNVEDVFATAVGSDSALCAGMASVGRATNGFVQNFQADAQADDSANCSGFIHVPDGECSFSAAIGNTLTSRGERAEAYGFSRSADSGSFFSCLVNQVDLNAETVDVFSSPLDESLFSQVAVGPECLDIVNANELSYLSALRWEDILGEYGFDSSLWRFIDGNPYKERKLS